MDGKRSDVDEFFVCRALLKGSVEYSLEEDFYVKRTARQIATDFIGKLRVDFHHSQPDLINSARNSLAELSEAQSALAANRDRIRVEFGNLQRKFSSFGRQRLSVLGDALPHEINSLQCGSDALPRPCVFLFNDVSIEERYAAQHMLARRVSERKRIELATVLHSSIINYEANCCLRDQLSRLLEIPDTDQVKGDGDAKVISENKTTATTEHHSGPVKTPINAEVIGAFSENQDSGNVTRKIDVLVTGDKQVEIHASSLKPECVVLTTERDSHSRTTIVATCIGSDAVVNCSSQVSDTTGAENQKYKNANVAKLNESAQQVSTQSAESELAELVRVARPDLSVNKADSAVMPGGSLKQDSDVNTLAPLHVNRSVQLTSSLNMDRDLELALVTRVNTELNTNQSASLVAITEGGQVECSVVFCNKSVGPATLIAADKENYYVPAQVLASGALVSKLPPDFVLDKQEDKPAAAGWPVAPVLAPEPHERANSGLADTDASANANADVDIVATPQCASRVRPIPINNDQSETETPSRNLLSVSSFMPPLSSTVIHPGLYEEDDDDDNQHYASAKEYHCPKTSEPEEVAPSGVNPIADGYGMYVYDLKDGEDENDPHDTLGVGAPPARRDIRLKKSRRSSTTFQRRAVVEMSPIVEVSSSSSSNSGSVSATTSQSNCNSTNASRSRCTSVTTNQHRSEGDIAYETCNDIQEPSVAAEFATTANIVEGAVPVPSTFDYVRLLFPKGATILDVNSNNIVSLACPESPSVSTTVWRENPCSTASQLAKLEQSGFLRAILDGHVDCVNMQIDSTMPEALTKLADKARRSSTSQKYVSTAPYSTLNVSQSKVKHDGAFRLGTLTYDQAALVATGAFANCFRLRRRSSECEGIFANNRRTEVLAKLFVSSPTAAKTDGANATIPEAERLRTEAIWETYVQSEISKRRAELMTGQPQNDTAHRFVAGFIWLDHAVVLRNSAAIIYQLPDGAAVTLGALLDCARRIRAVDSTRGTTLPFNEPLAHLCTVELCELVRTLVRIGIVHTDIRAEKLMVARLTFDSKCFDSFRSGEPFLKLIDFSTAIDMRLYGIDSKFDSSSSADIAARRCGNGACPAMHDLSPWSYDMDMYCTARVAQALIQSNNDTADFEKRDGAWRESVPLKRRWNVVMWENFFREMLCYQELTTRDATLAKLDGIIETLWGTFEQKRTEKVSSLMSDIKCLREHL